ncbi:UNVERIFIED_CONTAM: MLP-like protein [Sesamum calycinum]|uniref:MLP-like protein n=1 Tax=Sesamum calycinum TaxID=2727403 RepID=A0AAW2QY16_9LAMI
MAAPSPWRWPLNYAGSSSLRCSTTIFPLYYAGRHRVITWSSDFNSSSSSSSSSCACSVNNDSNTVRKRVRKESVGKITCDGDPESNGIISTSGKGGGRSVNNKLSFKSLFGKRALWRRILFASRKVRSIILLNVITVIYASNIPVVKEVEAIIDPEVFNLMRFAVAAIPFIPIVLQARDDANTRNAGIELGFWVSLGYIMQALGLLTSDAGRASFISMFTVVVVPLIDGMLGSAVPPRTWFGAFMSIIGVAMLESSGSPPCVGDLLNFISALSFGIHMLRTEHISRSTKRENFLPLLGYEMAAMCDVSATETAIVYGLEPVWGAGFAWFLLGERWGVGGWIGAALVLDVENDTISKNAEYKPQFRLEECTHRVCIREFLCSFLALSCCPGDETSPKLCFHDLLGCERNPTFGPETAKVSPLLEMPTGGSIAVLRRYCYTHLWIPIAPHQPSSYMESAISVLLLLFQRQVTGHLTTCTPTFDDKCLLCVRNAYRVTGVAVVAKDKIVAVDEENKSITFELIGGEVTKYFNTFRATFQATVEGDRNMLTWSVEYEKASEDVPHPHSHLEFLVNLSREVDAFLVKA